mmetsp:Transcript_146/g.491  ORF Transcript_146/g.491 Transcript_146/m.491 type:complete len:258 (+) Transcript_146:279-1052(+)
MAFGTVRFPRLVACIVSAMGRMVVGLPTVVSPTGFVSFEAASSPVAQVCCPSFPTWTPATLADGGLSSLRSLAPRTISRALFDTLLVVHTTAALIRCFELPRALWAFRVLVPQLCNRLGEVHFDPAVVDEDAVHLFVCLFTGCLFLKLNEGVVQGVARHVVSDDFALHHFPEPRKNELEILVSSDRIEFADEQDVVWCLHLCIGQIAEHLQDSGSGLSFFFLDLLLDLLLCSIVGLIRLVGSQTGWHCFFWRSFMAW